MSHGRMRCALYILLAVMTFVRCQSDYDPANDPDNYSEKVDELAVLEDEGEEIDYEDDAPKFTLVSISKPVTTKSYRRSGFWRRPISTTEKPLSTITEDYSGLEDVSTTKKTMKAQPSVTAKVKASERHFKDTGFWRRVKNKMNRLNTTTTKRHKHTEAKTTNVPKLTTFKWSPKHRHKTEHMIVTEKTSKSRPFSYKFDRKSQLEGLERKNMTNKVSIKHNSEETPKIYKIISKAFENSGRDTSGRTGWNRSDKDMQLDPIPEKDEDMFYDVKVLFRVRNKIKPMRKRSQGAAHRRRPIKPRGVVKDLWGKGRQLLAGTTTTLRSTLEGIEIDLAEQWVKFVNTYDNESHAARTVELSKCIALLPILMSIV